MTLKTQINNELDRLASLCAAGSAKECLNLDVEIGQLQCALTVVDQLACAFEQLTLKTNALSNAPIDRLQSLAETLSSQLTYLLEAISPVEVDEESCVVQLRSSPPTRGDGGTSYYELVVRRGEIGLCRYHKAPGQQRRVISATVTREVFQRIADDLVRSIAS